jgi:hypothetical protein
VELTDTRFLKQDDVPLEFIYKGIIYQLSRQQRCSVRTRQQLKSQLNAEFVGFPDTYLTNEAHLRCSDKLILKTEIGFWHCLVVTSTITLVD